MTTVQNFRINEMETTVFKVHNINHISLQPCNNNVPGNLLLALINLRFILFQQKLSSVYKYVYSFMSDYYLALKRTAERYTLFLEMPSV